MHTIHASMRSLMKTAILAIAVVFLAAGCTTTPQKAYDGPDRDTSELAVITNKVDYAAPLNLYGETGEARLIAIDTIKGENGDMFGYHSKFDGSLNVAVLPGERSLTVIFLGRKYRTTMQSTLPITFRFNAEKGHIYSLSYSKSEDTWSPLLIDTTINKQVYPSATK
jgi:hypothetical protein